MRIFSGRRYQNMIALVKILPTILRHKNNCCCKSRLRMMIFQPSLILKIIKDAITNLKQQCSDFVMTRNIQCREMTEDVQRQMAGLNFQDNKNVPIYVISSIAEELLAYTNVIPEWLCKEQQEKVPNSSPAAASASSDIYGSAVLDACEQIKARMAPIASEHNFDSFAKIE
ncbi:hypothetical protein CMV_004436 [Castanea mollissima]|uniref:Aldehyde oxidase/xanthine dehydrogenase second molybdopterin binding domain-containing protein n=1 Tax=Castanea mollissima TaxID=60419 RepID=A0A8J4RFI2_9ROSI|nr:hypothetical protein CMV_004436 [Castanea mollissima]